MFRYFYIGNQLQDIQLAQMQLQAEGFNKNQIHVLSGADTELYKLELNPVSDLEKNDLVNVAFKGFAVGLLACLSLLIMAFTFGWADSQLNHILLIFMSLALLGFCTWEGGLIGIQLPNARLKHFQSMLDQHKHILMVDVDSGQRRSLFNVVNKMNALRFAGARKITYERIFSH